MRVRTSGPIDVRLCTKGHGVSIVAEIHAVREALSNTSGGDIGASAEAAKARQAQGSRPSVTLAPREVKDERKAS